MASKLITVFLLILTPMVVISKKTNIPKRHAIKTIRVKDGDIVDCVDIYKQLAFKHPALQNHTIQMKSSHLDRMDRTLKALQKASSSKAPLQLWVQYGRCPNGTIPIRRSSNNHQTNKYSTKFIHTQNRSYAVALAAGYNYTGARANIKVVNPYVELTGDYSSSQVMLWAGPPNNFENKFETVEVGWALDGKKKTGCFDHTCPGFVQTSSEVLLGGDIGTYNNGTEMTFQISKDPETNNWWFIYNDNEVGYWPSELFKLMKHRATMVQWGGEVYSSKVGTHPHTATAMGSGQFADRVYRKSGTITGMLTEEDSYPLKRPESFTISSDEWSCYDADLLDKDVPEPVLLYGGPGSRLNPNC